MADQMDHETCVAAFMGRLSPERMARVRAWLDTHPEAERNARMDAMHERVLAQAYEDILYEPVPERLRLERHGARSGPWFRRIAAAASIALAVAGGWWMGNQYAGSQSSHATQFTTQVAALVHQQPGPARVTTASHAMVTTGITAPDLSNRGYRLMQQRVQDTVDGRPLVEFTYRNTRGRQVRIYAEKLSRRHSPAPEFATRNGVHLAHWRRGDTRYAMVGDVAAPTLQQLARVASRRTDDTSRPFVAAASKLKQTAVTNQRNEVPAELTKQQPPTPAQYGVVPVANGSGYDFQE